MKHVSAVALVVLVALTTSFHEERALARGHMTTAQSAPSPCDDPWTVCVFQHTEYSGDRLVLTIEPGMRQLSVASLQQGFDNQISSIKVGANVAVWVFDYHDFGRNMLRKPSPARWDDPLPPPQPDGMLANVFIFPEARPDQPFRADAPDLAKVNFNDAISSLIVFPRSGEEPQGIWGYDEHGDRVANHVHFFPVPDSEDEAEWRYRELGTCCDLDKNLNVINGHQAEVSVVLYEGRDFLGGSLTLPSEDTTWGQLAQIRGDGRHAYINLGRYAWSDRAASMVVRFKGPSPGRPKAGGFGISLGIDYLGHDYKRLPAKNGPFECEKACLSDAKCKGFTWTRGDDATCFLKTELAAPTADPACISGNRVAPMKVEQGVDRPGADYKRFALEGGADDCRKACEADARCKAFTWVPAGTQGASTVCWLKSSVPAAVANEGVVSGYVESAVSVAPQTGGPASTQPTRQGTIGSRSGLALKQALQPTIILEPGFNRPGGDYQAFNVAGGYEDCRAACARDSRCKSFTWVRAGVVGPSAACWLKETVPVAIPNPDTVSGVVK